MTRSRLVLLAALLASPPCLAQERAGVSAAVRGDVQVASAAATGATVVGRQARSGEAIFLGDQIRSAADSGMQLMLLDETTFTIGPSSEIVVDRFIYDPAQSRGEVAVSVARGAFRFVTGKVAKNDPRDMQVRTPAGTIGIRGTIVYGRVDGARVTIALGGPGGANNAGTRRGGFDFIPAGGGAPIEVRRTGWAIVAEPGVRTQMIELPRERLDALSVALVATAPPPPGPGEGGGQPAVAGPGAAGPTGTIRPGGARQAQIAAGQTTAVALTTLVSLKDAILPASYFDQLSLDAYTQSFQGLGDFTTFGQLMSLTSGTGTYGQLAVPMLNILTFLPDGTYNFNLTINFGARTYVGSFSNIAVPSIGVAGQTVNITLPNIPVPGSYAGVIPPLTELIAPFAGTNANCPTAGTTCQGTVLFQNTGGIVAKTALHQLFVFNGANGAIGQGTTNRP